MQKDVTDDLLFLQGLKARTLHDVILLHQNHTHLKLKGGRQQWEGDKCSAAAKCDSTPGCEGLFRIKKCLLGQLLQKIMQVQAAMLFDWCHANTTGWNCCGSTKAVARIYSKLVRHTWGKNLSAASSRYTATGPWIRNAAHCSRHNCRQRLQQAPKMSSAERANCVSARAPTARACRRTQPASRLCSACQGVATAGCNHCRPCTAGEPASNGPP